MLLALFTQFPDSLSSARMYTKSLCGIPFMFLCPEFHNNSVESCKENVKCILHALYLITKRPFLRVTYACFFGKTQSKSMQTMLWVSQSRHTAVDRTHQEHHHKIEFHLSQHISRATSLLASRHTVLFILEPLMPKSLFYTRCQQYVTTILE